MIHPSRLTLLSVASVAVLLLFVIFGCTPKNIPTKALESPAAAWKVFRRHYCIPASRPGVLIKASLYYTRTKPRKRTNRTLVSMWGDFNGPMRLDISAGMGKLLAHIREDQDGLLVFYPTEKKAYAHVDPVLGATRLGMPFPFSLSELANVVMGDFSGLAPRKYLEAARDKKGFTYTVESPQVTSVTLDEIGRPILLEGVISKAYDSARTWQLEIDKYEEVVKKTAPLADRLVLSLDNGEKGVLRIKSRELKMASWPASATGLELPENIELHRLDNGHNPSENNDIPVVYED